MENQPTASICRHLIIHGRVQGVWYRASTQKQAAHLGVSGWVKNRPDGTVEVQVTGRPENVAALIDWCHQGPPGAHVERIEMAIFALTVGEVLPFLQ
ncbi:MAG: acylphosphatase [Magnetococcales bacterium]|nr:acylphosphatase [Magnetococcales bacterium]HIJ82767.1 acylphosphatase [Magnetococcales bacterium]